MCEGGGGSRNGMQRSDETLLGSTAIVFRHVNDPHVLETYACREALSLAEDLGVQHIRIASDCVGVVNEITRGTGGLNVAIVHEIMNCCIRFTSDSFKHERRNFSFEPHNLSKFACNLGIGKHVWLGNPHDPNLVPMIVPCVE